MKTIGKLKTYTSDEIQKSYVGIGFECLDRDLFNPDKCYDLLQATGVKYAQLLAITASVIRKVIPDAKIIADVSNPYCFEFTEAFLNSVDKKDIDVFSFHAYSAVPEFRYRGAVELLRKMLDTRGMQHVELWQGEGGYPSWAYKGRWLAPETGCDSERSQAVWQLRRFFLDVYNGIKLSSFFMMADVWEKPYAKAVEVLEKPAAHGILNGLTYTPKKSYETIKNAAATCRP